MPNPNFTSLLTTTLNKHRTKLNDAIFSGRAFTFWLLKGDRFRDVDGGVQIVEPLIYAMNGTFQTYGGYDSLPLTPQDEFTAAQFPWRQASVTVAISGIEEAMNSGSAAVINLLKSKIMVAQETAKEKFNQMFIVSDGTGNSGKDFLGLAALVGDATHGPATVGGIDATQSGNAFWRSYVDDNSGSDTAWTLAAISKAYDSVSIGNDTPDFEITTMALWEKYESSLQPQMRFTNAKMADAGFQALTHRGATVVWDNYIPAKSWYLLNSKYIGVAKLKGKWLSQRPAITPEDKDASYSVILSYGNMTTSNRRMQALVSRRT